MYSADKNFPVYDSSYWNSDKWSGCDLGQIFTTNRPFFEQFSELLNRTPRSSLINSHTDDSGFFNCTSECHNSYMTFNTARSHGAIYSSELLDCE